MAQTQKIEKHGGFNIYRDPEDGYFWENGSDGAGYFDTIEECRRDIDSYNADDDGADFPRDEPQDALDTALDPRGPWGAP